MRAPLEQTNVYALKFEESNQVQGFIVSEQWECEVSASQFKFHRSIPFCLSLHGEARLWKLRRVQTAGAVYLLKGRELDSKAPVFPPPRLKSAESSFPAPPTFGRAHKS